MENLGILGYRRLLPMSTGTSPLRRTRQPSTSLPQRLRSRCRASHLTRVVILASCFATAALAHLASGHDKNAAPGTPRDSSSPLIFVQAPELNTQPLDLRFPRGSRLVRLWPLAPDGEVKSLTPEFFAAADPQVSFDGKKILFAGKASAKSRWQIWEMNADGSGKRQITKCEGDCLRPAYLPRGQIVYTAVSSSGELGSTLRVAALDGSGSQPITFGPTSFQLERVLQDGRLLVSASYPLQPAGSGAHSREFYTLHPDGTGLRALRCQHEQGTFRGMVEELASGSLLYVDASGADAPGGTLMRLDRGESHNRPASEPGPPVRSAIQLATDELLVARQDTAVNGESRAAAKFGLYTFDLSRRSPDRLVYSDPAFHCVDPVLLSSRPAPRYFWSVVNPKLDVGYFIGLKSHLTAAGGRPAPAAMPSRVRVILGSARGSSAGEGEDAPVESDGSFYVSVPADSPLRFQLLDAQGEVLQEQRGWIWVRPGEQRACLGCHADPALVPENAIPKILLRSDVPTPIGQPKAGSAVSSRASRGGVED